MDDWRVPRVEVRNGIENFFDHLFGSLLIQLVFSMNLWKKLPVRRKLQDQIDILAIIESIVKFYDIGMI